MESNKIDELFKKKLERHSQPVSSNAWSEVKTQMKQNKKSKPKFWYVAASISLLLSVSFGINNYWNKQQDVLAVNPIDLNNTAHLSAQADVPGKPEIKSKEMESVDALQQKSSAVKNIQTPATQLAGNYKTKTPVAEMNIISLEKISAKGADIAVQMEKIQIISIPDLERKSDIKVEMYYEESLIASTSPSIPLNSLNKSANKLKSLASELSLAELRSAKNQLFASAFQTNKKSVNN